MSWVPIFAIVLVMTLFCGGVGLAIVALYRSSTWSLAETLSEEAKMPPAGAQVSPANPGTTPTPPPVEPPKPAMVGSASRLIGFFGLIGLLALYMGLGVYVLWCLFRGDQAGVANVMGAVKTYLLCGITLFAPYAVNQFRSAFSS
jgi:hypothetical protein